MGKPRWIIKKNSDSFFFGWWMRTLLECHSYRLENEKDFLDLKSTSPGKDPDGILPAAQCPKFSLDIQSLTFGTTYPLNPRIRVYIYVITSQHQFSQVKITKTEGAEDSHSFIPSTIYHPSRPSRPSRPSTTQTNQTRQERPKEAGATERGRSNLDEVPVSKVSFSMSKSFTGH